MRCTVCAHPEVEKINTALIQGEPLRSIASRFGTVGRMAIQRHKEDHLAQTMIKAKEAGEIAHADDLLKQVKALQGKATSLLLKAEKEGDIRTALAGIREARGCVELLAKLTGELAAQPVVNVTITAEWLSIRSVILNALEGHPAARIEVARALSEVAQ
jgi:hypothetical protein